MDIGKPQPLTGSDNVKRFCLIALVLLATIISIAGANAQAREFVTIDHVANNCDIRTAGLTVLRCSGRSYNSQSPSQTQMATLVFACIRNKLSISLGHAGVADEVLSYAFTDSQQRDKKSDDHSRISRIRTGYSDSNSAVPHWIYFNVTHHNPIDWLRFSLNRGEVAGEFNFDTSDRRLFLMYFAICPFGTNM